MNIAYSCAKEPQMQLFLWALSYREIFKFSHGQKSDNSGKSIY